MRYVFVGVPTSAPASHESDMERAASVRLVGFGQCGQEFILEPPKIFWSLGPYLFHRHAGQPSNPHLKLLIRKRSSSALMPVGRKCSSLRIRAVSRAMTFTSFLMRPAPGPEPASTVRRRPCRRQGQRLRRALERRQVRSRMAVAAIIPSDKRNYQLLWGKKEFLL